MNNARLFPIDLAKANAKLCAWRKKYDTPEKIAAEHRRILLDRVVESMAFEAKPLIMARLKSVLRKKKEEDASS
jgi:hypothetical protein